MTNTFGMIGHEIRHDLAGFYICSDDEADHEDAGNASVGFDGRPHYASIEDAFAAYVADGGEVVHVELTPIGEQYVIPGCERDATRGPKQGSLWE